MDVKEASAMTDLRAGRRAGRHRADVQSGPATAALAFAGCRDALGRPVGRDDRQGAAAVAVRRVARGSLVRATPLDSREPERFMARGFYDLAIAAPSKAALEAWGAGGNPSHQGVAKEGDDPNVVAATMSRPGVVFKRPAGSNRPFAEHSDLPSELGIQRERDSAEKASPRSRRSDARPRSASGMPESPPPISRRSSSAATPSAGAKRPPGKGGGNGARSRWQKRKLLWTRPSASTRRGPRPSRRGRGYREAFARRGRPVGQGKGAAACRAGAYPRLSNRRTKECD